MAYNHINKLLMYKKVLEIVNKHFDPDVTTYAGVWRKYVYPVYPMSYATFIKIINTPVDRTIKGELAKRGVGRYKQLSLFDKSP